MYVLREKVKAQSIVEDIPIGSELALPEAQEEVDEMTEYNTAHNRKISTLGIADTHHVVKKGVKRKSVHFNEEEIIINPEDVDPSIGRFRNLVQSTVIIQAPNKRMRVDGGNNFNLPTSNHNEHKHILHHPIISAPPPSGLYTGLNEPNEAFSSTNFLLPNPAPEIDSSKPTPSSSVQFKHDDNYPIMTGDDHEPKKKKYKKETWHGVKKAVKAFGDI
jgi:nuclear inhibitor of protein phosphatase 1